MIIKVNGYCFFDKKNIGSKRKMQKYFGVKNKTYAGNIIERVYYYYFGNAINLKKYFKRYYSQEFQSFEEFLIYRLNLSNEFARKIADKNLYFTNLNIKQDTIQYLFDDDEDKLTCIFEEYVGGIEIEN